MYAHRVCDVTMMCWCCEGTHGDDGDDDYLEENIRDLRPKSSIQKAVEDKMLQLSKLQQSKTRKKETEESEHYVDEIENCK